MGLGYPGGMPKVSVYLPDYLYQQARERGLPLSTLTQTAVEQAVRHNDLRGWIDHERRRSPRLTEAIDTAELIDEVRKDLSDDRP